MNLLSLPTEILASICLYLGVADSYALQSVNRRFLSLYRTSIELQYALECQVACVDDNPRCCLPVATRLLILRNRESAWRSLKPTSRERISLPGTAVPRRYGITRSHYMLGLPSSSLTSSIDGIHSYPIQTQSEDSSWSVVHTEGIVDFGCCIDECDLIACVSRAASRGSILELYLHLFQHSTGNPHPLATNPKILLCREEVVGSSDWMTMTIEVVGEIAVLAVEATSSFKKMYVLNWKTGESRCNPIIVSGSGLVVLSHDLFINPNIDWDCLDIYHIPQPSQGETVRLIQRLGLPKTCEDTSIHSIQCWAAPNPTGDNGFPKYVPASVPFVGRPENAIMLFRLDVEQRYRQSDLSMIVHRCSVMKLLPPPQDWPTISSGRIREWQEWGPEVSCWMENKAHS
ncbi:hypothetical protein P691DRAFT_668836 [Macrolepiota fuliginosa MF-IS2]|uniref:F-box domain-containing protein n=1 Tax=Macrolepiota fuliginosa MF-IS2 TaxID=1400762 RepID=A0A9P5XD15_9AGAR|nr:hypothetical protein P691DRAFT_668836 [Macrolepiota fuliginosa MF-IS2]